MKVRWVVMYISCTIFEHVALQVGSSIWIHKLRSTSFKDGTTLTQKLADLLSFWRSGSTPIKYWIKYSWSGSNHILYYINMSVRWNTFLRNQILSCQHVFYYSTFTYAIMQLLEMAVWNGIKIQFIIKDVDMTSSGF